jgi:uncharacterized protein (DUF2141 family)
MKRIIAKGTVIAVILGSVTMAAAGGNIVTVRVSTFRSLKGSLRCRLFSRPDGFPGKPPFEAETSVTVSARTMTCSFTSVAPGIHAVAVFHDENGDGKLDTNFLGIPREGVGVSNNNFRSVGPPSWDDAKFTVNGNLALNVTLRY